jgi:hypothetical protein
MIGGVAALALFFALWALAQRQAIEALHEAIGEMKAHCRSQDVFLATWPPLSREALRTDERGHDQAAAGASSDREALQRHGADLLVANNYEEALRHYRLLAGLIPQNRAFGDLVEVLEAKLGCRTASGAKSPPCL